MIFLVITEHGIETQPLSASSQADAAAQLKLLHGQGNGQVKFGIVLADVAGLIQQADDPANATIAMTGDAQTQQTIRQNLAAYLALQSPTNAQTLAAVRALARLAIGDFTGST